jgi:tetratricopeptide (TPR) repeat protein
MIFIVTYTKITVMYKKIFISSLTLASVLLGTINNAHAALTSNSKTISVVQIETRKSDRYQIAATTYSSQSMRYLELGMAAQKQGRDKQALLYYYKAITADETNAYAFMGIASLNGANDEGILYMTAAATLFKYQDNQKGYELAMKWLKEYVYAE